MGATGGLDRVGWRALRPAGGAKGGQGVSDGDEGKGGREDLTRLISTDRLLPVVNTRNR